MPISSTSVETHPTIETVVVQPTPFCNIQCSYCYLPQRNLKTVMGQSTIALLFAKIFASGWTSQGLTVIWHAGEPLVVPISFYQTAFAAIEAARPASLQLRHSFQTNGMLITPEWCELFKQWDVGVGVSIDGPKHLHDAHRVTRSGGGSPTAFDFLGFCWYYRRTRAGNWTVACKTRRARLARAIQRVYAWCRDNRHLSVREQHAQLVRRVRGHINYFGVNGNIVSLRRFVHQAQRSGYKWLNRRSQRARLNWERFEDLLEAMPLPNARIVVHIWR